MILKNVVEKDGGMYIISLISQPIGADFFVYGGSFSIAIIAIIWRKLF